MDSVPGVEITDANVESGGHGSYLSDTSGLAELLNSITLTIVCVTSLMAVICVTAMLWLSTKWLRQKLRTASPVSNSEESKTTNSAPVSRIASPKLSKNKSCPCSLSAISCRHNQVASSVTARCIPEIIVTREHVQPGSPKHTTEPGFVFGVHQKKDQIQFNKSDTYQLYRFPEDNEPQNQGDPHGWLGFSVMYDDVAGKLQVNLMQVQHLPGRNNSHPRDPYVKIFLLPDDKTCRESKVKKNTLNPVFNETHTFQVTAGNIRKHALRFSVYDIDNRRVRHSLGHVVINLRDLDLTSGDVIQTQLEPIIRTSASVGELQMSLLYVPPEEKMMVAIHNARNLHCLEDYHEMGVYLRIQLFYGHKCHRIKYTAVHPGSADMTFNETLTFTINGKLLETCNTRISVMLTSSTICAVNDTEHGTVILGPFMFARGDELAHWQEMLSRPETVSTRWHTLTRTAS